MGNKVNDKLIGIEFIPKNREYDAKNTNNIDDLKNWNGDPEFLKKFEDEDSDIYRIGALTEKSHLYLDMGLTTTAENLISKEKKLLKIKRI